MQVYKKYRSPHFENQFIPVEFVILHYTAQSLKESLNIFLGSKPVSCHILIDRKGFVYEMVSCWQGGVKKAFHSGKSFWRDRENNSWKNFNDFSLGIEIVNWNGNIFPFTLDQYESLSKVLKHFQTQYSKLNHPERILGHEHISGFRGKKDPGYLFNWNLLFQKVYSTKKVQKAILTKKEQKSLSFLSQVERWNDRKAKHISLILENNKYPFWMKKILCAFVFYFLS
ncbi:MAG: N-acetylmuramoyl-L-alanine amidase [Bdellovibrionales bacterium]|nr:N-acetylmuramoyl-L-alanine amidase [Bdellovibrionales bacterium]